MNLLVAVGILAGAEALAVSLMLLVRRRSPVGSFFKDTEEAAGVFAVAGTAFAVLLAFVFFLAFQSYDSARKDARGEADAVTGMFRTASLFPTPARLNLQGQLVCYGRAVVDREWPDMRHDRASPVVQGWIDSLDRSLRTARIGGDKPTTGLSHWFDQAEARQTGRRGRLAEAGSVVPPLVWLVLIVGGAVVIAYTCFFADPGERRLPQALMMFAVSTMVASSLLVIRFLDHPYENHSGSIEPTAMRSALAVIATERAQEPPLAPVPCDRTGLPRPA
jgi:Protein of unknown function (DUF4239)